ncbi:DUF551 domain-containing protein [Escherichia sp. E10V10]|nr:DUF551 domain-containing protein [Escherichia sp. E10V10]
MAIEGIHNCEQCGDEFFETQSRSVTDWMPLPEPPKEVNRG